ncbi:XTP/dITP diphosphatase [Limosilactobacillus sp. STM2_1]|uniref:dITP/XTP pyrophosphatase n=1 Tax=Limosilactobacillus rudii TaxID=2759755 RepID=A0A7W3ULS4_9LACO|nr:XTP/dITP diphosphatase [Limosilactobacillus rudii]MBB1079854.1 XTP/dITP diphosphatase [Limosilactobacillus rudii]MBB1097932.1 XTP/dITP diphosphatase [Limosilactobacillus rudii]MCD7135001.1 XTP/dITP diphosphatase [Limosilactobacillus rudii]
MKTIVIATKNEGKAREYQKMLEPQGIEIKTLADFPGIKIDENGKTFEENATIKAMTVAKKLQLPVMADDSGLVVDALNGAPGIHSARYAGDHDDAANNAKLLQNLINVPDPKRTAHFHTTIVAVKPDGTKLVAEGRVDGHILHRPTGENGFGYDPLFYVDELKKSMAELTADQKNNISHRGKALRSFMRNFNDWW